MIIKNFDFGYLGEFDIDVEFDYSPGYKGNWEEPPEPEEFDITSVFLIQQKKGFDEQRIDITTMVLECNREALIESIQEN